MVDPRCIYGNGVQDAFETLDAEVDNGPQTLRLLIDPEYHGNVEDQVWWYRFATVLQQSSNVRLEYLVFRELSFDLPNEKAFKQIFGNVLPTHKSLCSVEFEKCKILPEYIGMLTTSLVTNNDTMKALRDLEFSEIEFHPSSVAAIAQLLRARNTAHAPIEVLELRECSIDSTGCEQILQALDGNTYLEILDLSANKISDISLVGARALGNAKYLRVLRFKYNPLTVASLCHLAEGLRLTVSLEHLNVRCDNAQLGLDAFFNLIKTFNYSMESAYLHLPLDESQQGKELFRPNERIRTLHNKLLRLESNATTATTTRTTSTTTARTTIGDITTTVTTTTTTTISKTKGSRSYRLPKLSLWPLTLECIGSKPSLIYHFVRHGNVELFTKQVASRTTKCFKSYSD